MYIYIYYIYIYIEREREQICVYIYIYIYLDILIYIYIYHIYIYKQERTTTQNRPSSSHCAVLKHGCRRDPALRIADTKRDYTILYYTRLYYTIIQYSTIHYLYYIMKRDAAVRQKCDANSNRSVIWICLTYNIYIYIYTHIYTHIHTYALYIYIYTYIRIMTITKHCRMACPSKGLATPSSPLRKSARWQFCGVSTNLSWCCVQNW